MELSIEEKIKLVTGKNYWETEDLSGKLGLVRFADGPHGIRKQAKGPDYASSEQATCFPTISCLASSWDMDLAYEMAGAIAKEAIEKDISVVLGPGINIKRNPLCGRNFEYMAEDPYLSGKMAAAYIKGMQDRGVGSSLKHFAANNQESNRMTANSQIDERALREIYLRGFEIAVKEAKPATVMASYNRINGSFATENKKLLTQILRDEWGYEGLVISDWSACSDLVKSLEAGLDLEMPYSLGIHSKQVKKALKKGALDKGYLDRAADKVIGLAETYPVGKKEKTNFDIKDHEKLARRICEESIILLENHGKLPLNKDQDKEVVVIGDLAENMRYQAGGSSRINSRKATSLVKALEDKGIKVSFARGYSIEETEVDEVLKKEALDLSKKDCKIIFVGGLTENIEGEGFDRENMKLPRNQEDLLTDLTRARKDMIYISLSGAPYEFNYIRDIGAFIQVYLGGQEVTEALVRVLVGEVNPSGKLTETWARSYQDIMSSHYFEKNTKDLQYRESIFVGYRYFDTFGIDTRFEFARGLSYTDFEYSNLTIEQVDLETNRYRVSFDLENIGPYDGKEVCQVYVKNPLEYFIRSNRELKGFKKVFLKSGEKKRVYIDLDDHSFSIFDVYEKRFLNRRGDYEIQIGSSFYDIRLSKPLYIDGEDYHKVERAALAQYFVKGKPVINEDSFEYLYARRLSNFDKTWIGQYSLYHSINDMARVSFSARLVRKMILRGLDRRYKDLDKKDSQRKMIEEMAMTGRLDALICQSPSKAFYRLGLFLVNVCNKKRFRAVWSLLSGKP